MFRYLAAAAMLAVTFLAGCVETQQATTNRPSAAVVDAYNYGPALGATDCTHGAQAYGVNNTITREAWSQCGTQRPTLAPEMQPQYNNNYYYSNDWRHHRDENLYQGTLRYDSHGEQCRFMHRDINGEGWKCY